jgi:hypothetical protein
MTIQQRKYHLIQLGIFLGQFGGKRDDFQDSQFDSLIERMDSEIENSRHYNGWFTPENILFSLKQWSNALTKENLDKWLHPYQLNQKDPKTVGIIMAGNIPLVGFHDLISVLVSGNNVLVKQSSNDQRLLPVITDYLISLDPAYKERIRFTEGRMQNFDAVIATGSNNTARYFEYYFKTKPSIIRKNRNSVAILTGKESSAELGALGEDIFRYFGLGCRNVSKLYVPENYDFDSFYKAMEPWHHLSNHAKYANNYDYNKAVYLMSEFKFLDNGFLVLKNSAEWSSPIATIFYENYKDVDSLKDILAENEKKIQCIVSSGIVKDEISFGETQKPALWEYADNVDTLAFLETL